MELKVSIIIPYKEDRGWLVDAVESVSNQTYNNIELIFSQGEGGVSENLNNGIKRSTGDLIKYLCDDDWLPPNSIKDSVEGIKDCDFIHGNATNFFSKTNMIYQTPVHANPTLDQMLYNNVMHGGSLMYKREVFEKIGLFDESLWTGEEYEFNLRAMYNGLKLGYVDKNLYFYRRHENQKSLGVKASQPKRKHAINEIKSRYNS